MDRQVAIQVASLRFFSRSFVSHFFFPFFSPERRSARDKEHGAFRRILRGEIAPFYPDADQSLENTDSYPVPFSRAYEILSRASGRPDISREACRIVSRDKMSDLSSRERKRERRIKGQDRRGR